MALDKVNMFAQAFTGGAGKVGGIQPQVSSPIAPTSAVGANPFAGKNKDDGAVGLIGEGASESNPVFIAASAGHPAGISKKSFIG